MISRILTIAVCTAFWIEPALAATVGGFGPTRTLSSSYSVYSATAANAELNDAGNAVLYGDSISFASSTTTVTDSYLAGIDIFFTGLLIDGDALSNAETTALAAFINAGGVVITHGDNLSFDQSSDPLMNLFGLDIDNTSNNSPSAPPGVEFRTMTPSATPHPILDGPFGVVGNIEIRDSAYLLPATGDALNLTTYPGGQGGVGVVGPGAGRAGALIFLPDSETFGLSGLSGADAFRGEANAEILFNNAIAYAVSLPDAAVPLPASLPLLGGGVLILGAAMRRRNRRQSGS